MDGESLIHDYHLKGKHVTLKLKDYPLEEFWELRGVYRHSNENYGPYIAGTISMSDASVVVISALEEVTVIDNSGGHSETRRVELVIPWHGISAMLVNEERVDED